MMCPSSTRARASSASATCAPTASRPARPRPAFRPARTRRSGSAWSTARGRGRREAGTSSRPPPRPATPCRPPATLGPPDARASPGGRPLPQRTRTRPLAARRHARPDPGLGRRISRRLDAGAAGGRRSPGLPLSRWACCSGITRACST